MADRIAWHWRTVNEYLLQFAAGDPGTRVLLLDEPLEATAESWVGHLGVAITDHDRFTRFLAARPNAASRREHPAGFDEGNIERIGGPTWSRAAELAGRS